MKKLLLLGLLAGGLACQSASAKLRTFDFSAAVSDMWISDQQSNSTPGISGTSTVFKGDTITGRFSFDDKGFDSDYFEWGPHGASSLQLTFQRDGSAYTAAEPRWSISPPELAKRFIISTQVNSGPTTDVFINLGLRMRSDINVPAYDMFGTIAVSPWETHQLLMEWQTASGRATVYGDVLSVTELAVSPVPEPSTYAMLLVGAAVAAGAARRRAAGQAD